MNKVLVGSIVLLAVGAATPLRAADLAAKAPVYKAPAAIVWDWTGFYVGGNAGYSWAKWGNSGLASTASPSVNGALGGLQAGYNRQLDAKWVVGLEGDIQITGERASEAAANTTDVPGGPPPITDVVAFHTITTTTFANQWKFPWFGTLRGRVGGLVDPTTLIYGTGGLAVGDFRFSSQSTSMGQTYRGAIGTTTNPLVGTATNTVGPALSGDTTQAGWAIGAGVEKKFTREWSAKLEYLYLGFGTHTFLSGTGSATQIQLHDNILRVGLNYAFNR